MKPNVIAILGKSGSGKDTLVQQLASDDRFNLVVSATTRPKRDYEINGLDYIFMTEKEFQTIEKIEETCFNGWYYGTPVSALSENKINVIVINPKGYCSLVQSQKINLIKGYELIVNDKIRLQRLLNREENPDINELLRRFGTDNIDFDNFHQLQQEHSFNIEALNNETESDFLKNIKKILDLID